MSTSRYAFSIDEHRKTKLKQYAAAQGVSAAAVLKAVIDRLPTQADNALPHRASPTNSQVKIRLTSDEIERLDRHVDQLGFATRASWLTRIAVEALTDAPIATNDEMTELRRARTELASIGRNINQIARALNIDATSAAPTAAEIHQARDAVAQHKAAVMALLDRIELRGHA